MSPQNYTPIDDFIAKQTQESTPSWAPTKEGEPVISSEPIHTPELKEQGVVADPSAFIEVHSDKVEFPPEVQAVGVEVVDHHAAPLHISLPLTDDKVMQGLHAPITSSFRWLATLAIYILHKAHMTIKMVHGKATQVKE